jgi:predicted secreted protein
MLRKVIASAMTLACGASLALAIPAQAQSVAKLDAEYRLTQNGNVVYDDDCTIKDKLRDG